VASVDAGADGAADEELAEDGNDGCEGFWANK
jgi:hypothetical protein